MYYKKIVPSVFLALLSVFSFAQNITLSGYIKDKNTGETLIGANVVNTIDVRQGTTSNAYGFYSISLPKGNYRFLVSYIGYANYELNVSLEKDEKKDILLEDAATYMKELVITAEEQDKNVQGTQMGTATLSIEQVKKLPALMGETDILKALQLLPGVMSAGEGSSGFYVRGGGPDQNLVLLDEAVVYNPGHMLGFFSVFNSDALKNTTLIKGGMPAQYGGRLSSVVDISMKEGNDKAYGVEGGIGLISSRLMVEGPIQKDKSSFIISGRRTYLLDLLQPVLRDGRFAGTNYYFYDFNSKVNYRFSDKDRLYLSGYFGRDVFTFNSKDRGFKLDVPYGNSTATLRWNHLFSNKLFMNVAAVYNDYDFSVTAGQDIFNVKLFSGIQDWNGKIDFDYYPNYKHYFKFGVNYTWHRLTPSIATGKIGDVVFSNNLIPKYAHEPAIYFNDEWKISPVFSLTYGLRVSAFTQVGPYNSYLDTTLVYAKGEPVKTYTGLEPRVSGKVSLDKNSSIKFGVTRSNQYLHLVSNSTSTLPTDTWVPSTELVKPQIGIQYALGYFRNFKENEYETSVEVYYKDLKNQIDYPENYTNNSSAATDVELSFVYGKGRAYGAEFFIKKSKGKLNGWIGYTIARTERIFPDINNGKAYPAVYDRTHDLVLVANYELTKKWDMSANFIYATGNAFTPIRSLYLVEQQLQIEYAARNSSRFPAYHRFDISATYTPKASSTKKFKSSWTFSVYNTYNNFNPSFISYDFNENVDNGSISAKAYQVSLFPVIPTVTWNFKFK